MELLLGYAALDAAIAAVREATAELAAGRRDAGSQVDRLLDGGWSGAAAESFGAAWEEWLAGEAQVRAALAAIEEALVATGHRLSYADRESEGSLARLVERLAG